MVPIGSGEKRLSLVMRLEYSAANLVEKHVQASSGKRHGQGCQILLCPNIPKREILYIPNYHKLYQTAKKFTKWP
jgi:hypothetical protein